MNNYLHFRQIGKLFPIPWKTIFPIILLLAGNMMLTTKTLIAQTKDTLIFVNGKVTDSIGNPIVAASVVERGTTNGAYTNNKGVFTLNVSNKYDTLSVSSVGYKRKEVPLNGKPYIEISLATSSTALNQVVVVGYGTQKKVSVTGAISTITMDKVEKFSTPSLSNAIAGKLPGLISRQSSGEPGYDAAQVFVRGLGTWVNRQPLILVDGVERDMNNINPQEIESFSILKDASATAVYGVRGANGVILIHTKHGKVGKPTITLRTEGASLTSLRLPDYINGAQYAALMNEGLQNVGKPARWTQDEIEKFGNGSEPYLYPNVNWVDSIFRRTTYQTINNLSVSGGNQTVRYFTNVGYIVQNGIFKEDNLNKYNTNAQLKRYTFRSNVDINLSKSFIINLGLGGIIDNRNYPGPGSNPIFDAARETSPIAFPLRNPDGSMGGISVYLGSNPWGMATQSGYSNEKHSTLQGTFGAKWDLSSLITEGLSVSGKFAYDFYYHNKALRYKVFQVKQYLGINSATGLGNYALLREEQPLGYQILQDANRSIYLQGVANYDRTFDKHSIAGMLLFNRRDYINLTAGNSVGNLPYREQGIAGRATYGYDNRYFLEFDFGYNGSENFPKGRKYGFFPSISGGWVISNEKFWDVNFINNLKIRASYGKVGNDQIGGARFLFLTTINKNANGYFFGDGEMAWTGMGEDQIGNTNVTWEVAKKTNLGLDVGMFDDRVTLQVDFFKELRSGILLQRRSVPDYAGFLPTSIQYGNLGEVKNKGLDALLEIKNTTSSGFYYSFRGNFTYAHNIILENDEPTPKYAYQSEKGKSIDQPFGLVAVGFFKDQKDINTSATQTFQDQILPGDIKYADINGDGIINTYDRVAIGYPRTPEIMYGFGGTAAYKGFDVSIYFTGAAHTSLFLNGWSMYPFATGIGIFNILHAYYDNRWTFDNPNPEYPAVRDGNSPNNFQNSTVWQKNASYLRIRNAEIGYTLNKKLTRKYKIDQLRFFVNGTNLYTWDHVKVINPESNDGTGGYPLQMGVNVGLQVTFE